MLATSTSSTTTIVSQKLLLLPFVALILISMLAQFTSLDTVIANKFYEPVSKSWIGANSWWADTLIHDWGRYLIAFIFLSALITLVISYFVPNRLKKIRRIATYLCLSIILTTSLVSLGKKYSNVDCPRDLMQYGGNQPYTPVFSIKPASLPAGQCFPGGHSSGAFSLYALYFIFLLQLPRHARTILIVVSVLGITYGFGQWARGSHFIIHDIWSAAIGWYISFGLFYSMFSPHRSLVSKNTKNY